MDGLSVIIFRTVFMYLLIIFIFRLMGKREIGELNLLDLVVFMMVAEMAVLAIDDPEMALFDAILPMLILMVIQIGFAWLSLKFPRMRNLLDGKPTIIIHSGKVDERAMRSQRYNFDDLLMQLREQEIFSLAEVDYAILEVSGKLTVLKKQSDNSKETAVLPLPLILDGRIQDDNLSYLNINKEWLLKQLEQQGYPDFHVISYCSLYQGAFTIDERNV